MLIFFWLSQTWLVTLRIWELVFSGCNVLPNSKQTKLGSSSQEASPSAGKNNEVVLVSCSRMEVYPYSFSGGVDISEVHGCHLLQQMSSQWGSQKLPWGRAISIKYKFYNCDCSNHKNYKIKWPLSLWYTNWSHLNCP